MLTRPRFAALCAVAGSLLLGCNPCSGMGPCSAEPHVTVAGVLLDETTGAPVARARIDLVRTGGIALVQDSVRTLTDDHGNFVVSVGALARGEVSVEIVLRGAESSGVPGFSYRVFDLEFSTLDQAGDAHVLRPWSTMPTLPGLAQLILGGVPLSKVDVEFRRTGGVRLADTAVYRTATDDNGVIPLFQRAVQPLDGGDLVGDLYVVQRGLVFRGYRLPATPEFRAEVVLRTIFLDNASPGLRANR